MGTLDEHWCSVCNRKLDKKEDKYVEFELVNLSFLQKVKKKLTKGKQKGIICEKCLEENPELKEAIQLMAKAGNPNFTPRIACRAWEECENFEPSKREKVTCDYITVLEDKIYCRRGHPGSITLPREEAELQYAKAQMLRNLLEEYVKDPNVKELLNTALLKKDFLEHIYTPPSGIVEHADNGESKAELKGKSKH